jgi:hypothetical protein
MQMMVIALVPVAVVVAVKVTPIQVVTVLMAKSSLPIRLDPALV